MDKDPTNRLRLAGSPDVSTLVLMDSWIKTRQAMQFIHISQNVSTLVLMDSWIKTFIFTSDVFTLDVFQPLF